MVGQTNTQQNETTQATPVEGWWTGSRGLKNKINLGFSGVAAVGFAVLSQMEFSERPDDVAHGSFLQDNFGAVIQTAIDTPNTRHYFMPENLTQAGQMLADQIETQAAIQRDYVAGDQGIELAARDIENSNALLEARNMFRQGLDATSSAEIVVGAAVCNTTEAENVYSCRLTRAEIGGFVDPRGGLEACGRITDNFTVVADMDGAIEYIRTKGPGYSSTIDFDTTEQTLQERMTRGLMAYVTNDLAYFGAQTHPQERAAFERWSACLDGQQGPT